MRSVGVRMKLDDSGSETGRRILDAHSLDSVLACLTPVSMQLFSRLWSCSGCVQRQRAFDLGVSF